MSALSSTDLNGLYSRAKFFWTPDASGNKLYSAYFKVQEDAEMLAHHLVSQHVVETEREIRPDWGKFIFNLSEAEYEAAINNKNEIAARVTARNLGIEKLPPICSSVHKASVVKAKNGTRYIFTQGIHASIFIDQLYLINKTGTQKAVIIKQDSYQRAVNFVVFLNEHENNILKKFMRSQMQDYTGLFSLTASPHVHMTDVSPTDNQREFLETANVAQAATQVDHYGETPLLSAVEQGNAEAVRAILATDEGLYSLLESGREALEIAQNRGDVEIANAIQTALDRPLTKLLRDLEYTAKFFEGKQDETKTKYFDILHPIGEYFNNGYHGDKVMSKEDWRGSKTWRFIFDGMTSMIHNLYPQVSTETRLAIKGALQKIDPIFFEDLRKNRDKKLYFISTDEQIDFIYDIIQTHNPGQDLDTDMSPQPSQAKHALKQEDIKENTDILPPQELALRFSKELSKILKGLDIKSSDNYYTRNTPHVLDNLEKALRSFGKNGNLQAIINATACVSQFGSDQPNTVLETFQQALEPSSHNGIQAIIQHIRDHLKEIPAPEDRVQHEVQIYYSDLNVLTDLELRQQLVAKLEEIVAWLPEVLR